jgi:hypothetical protein
MWLKSQHYIASMSELEFFLLTGVLTQNYNTMKLEIFLKEIKDFTFKLKWPQ